MEAERAIAGEVRGLGWLVGKPLLRIGQAQPVDRRRATRSGLIVNDDRLIELARISGALVDALAEARDFVQRGEFGTPLRDVLTFARDLVALADETLAADPHAGEHARGMAMHMAEQLAALEAMLAPTHARAPFGDPLAD